MAFSLENGRVDALFVAFEVGETLKVGEALEVGDKEVGDKEVDEIGDKDPEEVGDFRIG